MPPVTSQEFFPWVFKEKGSQRYPLALSVEHGTLDLGVVSSSPTLGIEFT